MKISAVTCSLFCIFPLALAHAGSGHTGATGQKGEDKTIAATGTSAVIDVSGGNGGPGGDGHSQHAGHPIPKHYPGGVGGDGGNGGNLEIYFESPEQLKSIQVISQGGRGGKGGHSIELGNSARHGRDGVPGSLFLIQNRSKLPEENSVAAWKVGNIPDQMEVTLIKRAFSQHNGALSLLAPGSVIQDEYFFFERLIEKKIRFETDDLQYCRKKERDGVIVFKIDEDLADELSFESKFTSRVGLELVQQDGDSFSFRIFCK